MSAVVISGDTSGSVTLQAPAVSGSTTQNLVAASGTLAPLISGTVVNTTSGTSIDISTSIPSWVKRITVIYNGVSLSGSSHTVIQLGSGSYTTSGYTSTGAYAGTANSAGVASATNGFVAHGGSNTNALTGTMTIALVGSNLWVASHSGMLNTTIGTMGAGSVTLSGTLDRIRITSVNGTDTFDAGSVNIMYE